MNYKWIGAMLVIVGCGGFGFSLAAAHKRQETTLRQMMQVLQYMQCELQYKLTPLPELCRQAGKEASGALREVLLNLARELDWQVSPDVGSCMSAALAKSHDLPGRTRSLMVRLGHSLGRFDLPGQLQGLEALKSACETELRTLGKDRDSRIRSYQTLGLCAGAALAILLL